MAAKVAFSGAVRTRLPMGRPDRKPERRATPEEPAPIVPSGPTVKAQVTSTAPAPAGRSFRDALCGGRGAAAAAAAPAKPAAVVSSSAKPSDEEVKEHAAAPVTHTPEAEAAVHKEHTPRLNGTHPHAAPSAERAVKTATAVHEAEEDRRTQQHAADEHAEQQRPAHTSTPAPEVISTSSAVVEQETHVPEHVEHAAEPVQTDMTTATHAAPAASSPTPAVSANAHFNWATDDEINFQIPSPAPQYMVHYPAGMLENRARNIVFKAPVHTLASAVDTLTKEQLSFEAERRTTEERLKAREIEQNHKEAELASRERHLAVEMEKLQQERLRFTQAQQAAAAQAAAAAAAAAQAASQQQQQQQQQQVQQQIPPQPTPTVAPVPSAPPQSVQQQPVAPASRGYMNMSAVYQDWPHTSQQQQSQPSQQQQHPHQHLPSQQQQQQQQQLPQQGGGRWNNGDMMPNDMVPTYDMYNGGYPNIFPQQPQPRNFHFFRGEQNRNNMGRMPHHMASNFSRVQSNRPPMETPVNFTARPPPQQQTLPQQYMGANIGNTYNKNW